jgi:hypothetical protein
MSCEVFHDCLLDLLSGRLDSAEARAMLEHVARCPECESVLAMEEYLHIDRQEGVAENVPDSWVVSMWPAVQAEIGAAHRRSPAPREIRERSWMRIAVACLLATVLVGAGYLVGQWTAMGNVPVSSGVITRVDAPTRVSTPATISPADLLTALDRLPDDATVISPEDVRAFLQRSARLRRWTVAAPAPFDLSDGVQVGELRAVLETLPPDDPTILPASVRTAELRRWLKQRA